MNGPTPLGLLGSLVMQVGFEPPTVCVAIGKGRDHLTAVRESGRFALSIVDKQSSGVVSPFLKKLPVGESPFDGLATKAAPGGAPVLTDCLAWLDCRYTGEHEVGDHVVVFGVVEAGETAREGDPQIHLRKNGLAY
jgi:flavin reductase (DIM6/NTAB) family NADH-FMN oxidoreductase RutF